MLVWPATRFIAGEDVQSAYDTLEDLNERGIRGMVDLLGENVDDRERAYAARYTYVGILRDIRDEDLEGSISVKPTHLGLSVDYEVCLKNIRELLEEAGRTNGFVWMDMESSKHTRETIELYRELLEDYRNVGLCLQSYLRRTEEDVHDLKGEGKIRLVKGAYNEKKEIAFQKKTEVNSNYRKLMGILFENEGRFAIATHDRDLVEEAKELHKRYEPEDFEFQFLMGVRRDLQEELAEEGYRVSVYVPYGEEWFPYYWRRVTERKENLFFALKALLGR